MPKFVSDLENLAAKAGAVAATVAGALTAINHTVPGAVSSALVIIGPAFYAFWTKIKSEV